MTYDMINSHMIVFMLYVFILPIINPILPNNAVISIACNIFFSYDDIILVVTRINAYDDDKNDKHEPIRYS